MGMLMWLMIRDGEVGQDGDMEGDMEMRRSSNPIAEARASDHDESALEARAAACKPSQHKSALWLLECWHWEVRR
jgi:hypothetical protein